MSATTAITTEVPHARPVTLRTAAGVLLAAPLLSIGLLGIYQVVLVMWASVVLSQAAAAGAREAALPRATRDSIDSAVDRALSGHAFAERRGAIELTVNDWPAGDSSLAYATTSDRIGVRVELPAVAAVPDLLAIVGLSLVGDQLSGSAEVKKR